MFEWLSTRTALVVYTFLLFNALFESLFPPYPSDAFVLVFSFVAGRGHYNPYLVYLFTVVGSIIGIMIIYQIGRVKGGALIKIFAKSFLGRFFPMRLIERAMRKFNERGELIVLLNRFLPGMRAPICFAAGIVGIDRKKVFYYSLTSVMLWNLFLVMIGFYVGTTWDEASRFLRRYNILVLLLLVGILFIFSMIYFRRKNKIKIKKQ